MASIKTNPMASTDRSPVRYHVTTAFANHLMLSQIGANLVLSTGADTIVLTQTNAADIATAISNFGSTGTLS